MAITTRTLTNADAPILVGLVPAASASVIFRLCDLYGKPINMVDSISGETITSTQTRVYTNSAGVFTVDLWPNDRGATASYYKCSIKTSSGTRVTDIIGFLPDGESTYAFINFKDLDNVATTQLHSHSNKEVLDDIGVSIDNLPTWNGGTWPGGSGGGSGHIILNEGVALATRAKLDFVGATVDVTDDAGNDKSIVTLSATGTSHTHSGVSPNGPKLTQSVTHESPDTDVATSSIHHTIGTTATTAAAGNHLHQTTIHIVASTAFRAPLHADYICDGTNDEVQFASAIETIRAAGVGGKIVCSEGAFEFDAGVAPSSQVFGLQIEGTWPGGLATSSGGWGTTGGTRFVAASGVTPFTFTARSQNITFRNIKFDGSASSVPFFRFLDSGTPCNNVAWDFCEFYLPSTGIYAQNPWDFALTKCDFFTYGTTNTPVACIHIDDGGINRHMSGFKVVACRQESMAMPFVKFTNSYSNNRHTNMTILGSKFEGSVAGGASSIVDCSAGICDRFQFRVNDCTPIGFTGVLLPIVGDGAGITDNNVVYSSGRMVTITGDGCIVAGNTWQEQQVAVDEYVEIVSGDRNIVINNPVSNPTNDALALLTDNGTNTNDDAYGAVTKASVTTALGTSDATTVEVKGTTGTLFLSSRQVNSSTANLQYSAFGIKSYNAVSLPDNFGVGFVYYVEDSGGSHALCSMTAEMAGSDHTSGIWKLKTYDSGTAYTRLYVDQNSNFVLLSSESSEGSTSLDPLDSTGRKVFYHTRGIAPAASIVDSVQLFSTDLNGAGTTGYNIRTEDGKVFKFGTHSAGEGIMLPSGKVLNVDSSGNIEIDGVDFAGGGGALTYNAPTASFNATVNYFYSVSVNSGDVTATLPDPSGNNGKRIVMHVQFGANTLTVSGSFNVNMPTPPTLKLGDAVDLVVEGNTWCVLNYYSAATGKFSSSVTTPTIQGGTASGDDLTLSSTSDGTKGNINFGTSTYDEVNNQLVVGTTNPPSTQQRYSIESVGTDALRGRFVNANTTAASNTGAQFILAADTGAAMETGKTLGTFAWAGAEDANAAASHVHRTGASITVQTTEAWTTSANGTKMLLGIVKTGSDGGSGRTTMIELNNGNVILGEQQVLATTATVGHTFIPTCNGTPTGDIGTAPTGKAAIIYDYANNKLYVNDGGTAWTAMN